MLLRRRFPARNPRVPVDVLVRPGVRLHQSVRLRIAHQLLDSPGICHSWSFGLRLPLHGSLATVPSQRPFDLLPCQYVFEEGASSGCDGNL